MTNEIETATPQTDEEFLFDLIWTEFNPLLTDTLGIEYAVVAADGLMKRILDEGFTRPSLNLPQNGGLSR